MATSPAIDTIRCPECDVEVVPVGKQTGPMALGNHRWKEHGVRGKTARATPGRPGRPPKVERAEELPPQPEGPPRPMAVVRDIADAAKGKGPPTQAQLSRALGKVYGYGQMFRISRMVDNDPRLTDTQRVDLIERLSPTEQTCEVVASPFARAIARTRFNRTAGRGIVDNVDILDALVALAEVEREVAAYRRELRQVLAGTASGQVSTLARPQAAAPHTPAAGEPVVPFGADADAEPAAYAEAPRSPAPLEGRVISAEDVARSIGADLGELPPDVNRGMSTAAPMVPPSMEVAE